MPVSLDQYEQQQAVVVSSDRLRVTVLPDIGAKIISVVSLPTGTELLWRDPQRPLGPIATGAGYVDGDRSGLDDCFPTVDPCDWPGRPSGVRVAGHGEVWSRGWRWSAAGDHAAVFECTTEPFPFRLRRRVSIIDDTVLRLDYELTADGDEPCRYQWTGHPLFAASADMIIDLPAGTAATTAFATGGRIATGDHWSWPDATPAGGGTVDVSRVPPPEAAVNEKYWLEAPATGCRLRLRDGGRVVVDYDRTALPWLAVCVNYGGWPPEAPAYWVAVEPSTSPHDCLTDSVRAGRARCIRPGETQRWWWSLAWEPRPDTSTNTTGDPRW